MERTMTITGKKQNRDLVQTRALALTVEGVAIALIAGFYWQATLTMDIVAIVSLLLIGFVIVNAIAIFRGEGRGSSLQRVDWLQTNERFQG